MSKLHLTIEIGGKFVGMKRSIRKDRFGAISRTPKEGKEQTLYSEKETVVDSDKSF